MSEESDRMIILLQELVALKKATGKGTNALSNKKRRREISQEMKKLAAEKRSAQE